MIDFYRIRNCWKHFLRLKIQSRKFRLEDPELIKEIEFVEERRSLAPFPYCFIDQYPDSKYIFHVDEDSNMPYIVNGEKKLFFPEGCSCEKASHIYAGLCREQDKDSPHRYFAEDFYPDEDDVFVDVGCAEGNASLEVAEVVKGIYLFEGTESWMQPLYKTFGCYSEKCHIFNEYIGGSGRRLDDYRAEDMAR